MYVNNKNDGKICQVQPATVIVHCNIAKLYSPCMSGPGFRVKLAHNWLLLERYKRNWVGVKAGQCLKRRSHFYWTLSILGRMSILTDFTYKFASCLIVHLNKWFWTFFSSNGTHRINCVYAYVFIGQKQLGGLISNWMFKV